MVITFPYVDEDRDKLYEFGPSRYLDHLIGHKGPGGVYAYIRNKGWAHGIEATKETICSGTAFFTVKVELSEDGVKNYMEIVKVVFHYICLLRETPPQEWIFNELKIMTEYNFRFHERTTALEFTQQLSKAMQKGYPLNQLLSAPSVLKKFDADKIRNALDFLKPDNFSLHISSRAYPGGWDKTERWYGTPYRLEPIPLQSLHEVHRAATEKQPELHLPHENRFMPTNLKKRPVGELQAPELIWYENTATIWLSRGSGFSTPKASALITLRNPMVDATAESTVKAELYCELVKDALGKYSYDISLVGLHYSIELHRGNLFIKVYGYYEMFPKLLGEIFCCLRHLDVESERFTVIKERLLSIYRDSRYDIPHKQVSRSTPWLFEKIAWTPEQLQARLAHVTEDGIKAFIPDLLRQIHIRALFHGSLNRDDALLIIKTGQSTLQSGDFLGDGIKASIPDLQRQVRTTMPFHGNSPDRDDALPVTKAGQSTLQSGDFSERPRQRLSLAEGSNYIYEENLEIPDNVNNVTDYHLCIASPLEPTYRILLLLLQQIMEEPCYTELRTTEKLGYVVFCGLLGRAPWFIGFSILVQSHHHPRYLDARIETFLRKFAMMLNDMSTKAFEEHKRSVANKLLEKPGTLWEEGANFWIRIEDGTLDFGQEFRDAASLKLLQKSDMIDFFNRRIHPDSKTRAKLSVHGIAKSQSGSGEGAVLIQDVGSEKGSTLIQDVDSFKAGLEQTTPPGPVKDVAELWREAMP